MSDGYTCNLPNLPIRQQITVLPADKVEDGPRLHKIVISARGKARVKQPFKLGWTVSEKIGVAIINTRGLKAASKSIVIGK